MNPVTAGSVRLTSWAQRALASAGGGPTVTGLVVAGIIVGGAAGAFAGVGAAPAAPSGVQLAVYPCPDQGPPVLVLDSGQRMLVTGRTEDGRWGRIHAATMIGEAWVQLDAVALSGELDSVPVVGCGELGTAAPPIEPPASLTIVANNSPTLTLEATATPSQSPSPTASPGPTASPTKTPGPSPTKTPKPTPKPSAPATSTPRPSPTRTTPPTPPPPTPSPTPTTPPDTSPPKMSGGSANQAAIYEGGRPCNPKTVTLSVTASDDRPGVTATLFFRMQGQSSFRTRTMSPSPGAANRFSADVNTTTEGFGAGTLQYHFGAVDAAGNQARLPSGGEYTLRVDFCITQ